MLNGSASTDTTIFVIGADRSGTTLLRLMLTSHPAICIPPESLFFVQLKQKYGNSLNLTNNLEGFLDDLYMNDKFREWKVDRKTLQNNLSQHMQLHYHEAVSTVYKTYLQQFDPEARIWGDKNPHHIFHLDTILRHFPKSRIIHIFRDIRAVYNSLKSIQKHRLWQNFRVNIFELTKKWSRVVKIISEYETDRRFYSISYENLVTKPKEQLIDICAWLDIDFDKSMLSYHLKNRKKGLVPANRLKWHEKTLHPVSLDRIHAWQNELTISEVEALELINIENMKQLGYNYATGPLKYRGFLKLVFEYFQVTMTKYGLGCVK